MLTVSVSPATCLAYQGCLPFGIADLLPDGTTSALRAVPAGSRGW